MAAGQLVAPQDEERRLRCLIQELPICRHPLVTKHSVNIAMASKVDFLYTYIAMAARWPVFS